MLAFNTGRCIAATVRTRSAYHFQHFNTASHKYKEAEDSNLNTGDAKPKLPSGDSVAGQVIKLKQDHEVHKSKIDHLTEEVDKGFVDMKDGFKRTEDGFKRLMMLLIGVFILEGGLDIANSAGLFEKKSEDN